MRRGSRRTPVVQRRQLAQTIARNTYRTFERYELLSPEGILGAGWDFLLEPIMREGGYVRYGGRKSTQILRDCRTLVERVSGQPQAGARAIERRLRRPD